MTLAGAAVTFVHVALGTVVLLVAPAALLTRKGGRRHRQAGTLFSWAMGAVIVTAAFMWQAKGHVFLLFLDVVCAYLVFVGFRTVARRKRRASDQGDDAVDLAAAGAVFLSAIVLVALGARANTPLMRDLAGVVIALALIAAAFAGLELRALALHARTRKGSILMHVSATVGAYISAVTAFCVINFHGVPMLARWAVPSALGTLVIAYFSIRTRLRFARAERNAARARPAPSRLATGSPERAG